MHHGLDASLNCSRVDSYIFAGHGDVKPVPLNISVACDDTDVFVSIVFRNVPGTYDVVVVPSVNPFNPLQPENVLLNILPAGAPCIPVNKVAGICPESPLQPPNVWANILIFGAP